MTLSVMTIEDFRSAARKASILVVDDDDDVRFMMAESLRDFGYTVLEASSAEEAFPIALAGTAAAADEVTGQVDMVITDVRMPGMSGLELADRLQQARHDLKVIVMSGYFQPQPVAQRFLRKPFRMQELASAVRDELA